MTRTDPYTPGESTYECLECGERLTGETYEVCPTCGSETTNIAVPRE